MIRNLMKIIGTKKSDIGRLGEELAQLILLKRGFKIIERNWKFQGGEIDIVALSKDRKLCFIEVRLRTQDDYGSPEETINPAKIEKLRKGAEIFISSHPEFSNIDIRFDVIAIQLRYIENAF